MTRHNSSNSFRSFSLVLSSPAAAEIDYYLLFLYIAVNSPSPSSYTVPQEVITKCISHRKII